MKQIFGYVRRSTDKQEESLSQQKEQLRAFAKSQGWALIRIYEDDAISGSNMERPGLVSLMSDIEAGKTIDGVLVWDRNRLARPKDPLDGLLLERRLMELGKRVIYAATGQEADRSFAGGLLGYVEHYQNGDYLRKLSRDTMRGLVSRVKKGCWPGGPIPFGYDRLILDADGKPSRIVRDLPDKTQLILHAETGEELDHLPQGRRYCKQEHEFCTLTLSSDDRVGAVKRIFDDYATGMPIRRICQWLRKEGFRTARGTVISPSSIHAILENASYTGDCVYNKRTESKWHRYQSGQSQERSDEGLEYRAKDDYIVCENAWPAIIDKETFAAVQKLRGESKEAYKKVIGKTVHSEYLLTGIFTCGVCGGAMVGFTNRSGKGNRTTKRYYVCVTHHKGDHTACPKRFSIPADVVENGALDFIRQDLSFLRNDATLHAYIKEELEKLTVGDAGSRKRLQQQMAELDQKIAYIRDHLSKLDPETAENLGLYEQAKTYAAELQEIELELAKTENAVPELPKMEEIRMRARLALDSLDSLENVLKEATIEEKRGMLQKYIRAVKADPHTRSVKISLYTALFNHLVAGAGFEPTASGL